MDDKTAGPGLWWQKFYPVEGDSAVAEMWAGDEMWADLRIEGIHLEAVDAGRLEGAQVVLRVFGPSKQSKLAPDGRHWELEAAAALKQLDDARLWLLENERGRVPPRA